MSRRRRIVREAIACPQCGAPAGVSCHRPGPEPRPNHQARVEALAAATWVASAKAPAKSKPTPPATKKPSPEPRCEELMTEAFRSLIMTRSTGENYTLLTQFRDALVEMARQVDELSRRAR